MRDNPQTRVDETGHYLLRGLEPGFFVVREVVPRGYEQTFPEEFACDAIYCAGRGHAVNLEPGQTIEGLDFGNQPVKAASVHGVKWVDSNGNKTREDDERGLAGVTVYADVNLNNEFDRGEPSARTTRDDPATNVDETGQYTIDGLMPGLVIIREIEPDGYEQTFPGPLTCRAVFCNGEGHLVTIESGQEIKGIDFGNRPVEGGDAGSIQGVKWVDFNANGRRDDLEPGLPGVLIYADLNHNGTPEDNEPQATTMQDDPGTRRNERGQYRLEGLKPGEYVIREVVPDGMVQTFPGLGAAILRSESVDLPGGRALSYDLIGAEQVPAADGTLGVALTLRVVWPDSCGTLLVDQTKQDVRERSIQIDMFGTQVGDACLQALHREEQTINLGPLAGGVYDVRAVLHESRAPDQEFHRSFVVEARIAVGQDGSHHVNLREGQGVRGVDFGNRRLAVPPVAEVMDAVDLNHDGQLSAGDIDLLTDIVRAGNGPKNFDLSGDGIVDGDDVDVLVRGVMGVPFGDSNLDGIFDSSDLVKVFQNGKYEDSTKGRAKWEDGDWNGDGNFDTADMVFVFQQASYISGAERGDSDLSPEAVDLALKDSVIKSSSVGRLRALML
jgi:hypothetical protein